MSATIVDDGFACVRCVAVVRTLLEVEVDIAAELHVLASFHKRDVHVQCQGGRD